jgi:hypothetical protein
VAQHVYLDAIIWENGVNIYLPNLAMQTGYQDEDDPQAAAEDTPISFSDLYNKRI